MFGLPIFSWGNTRVLLEKTVKIRLVFVSEAFGNLRYRPVRCLKKQTGAFDADVEQVVEIAGVKIFLIHRLKVRGTDLHKSGGLDNGMEFCRIVGNLSAKLPQTIMKLAGARCFFRHFITRGGAIQQ